MKSETRKPRPEGNPKAEGRNAGGMLLVLGSGVSRTIVPLGSPQVPVHPEWPAKKRLLIGLAHGPIGDCNGRPCRPTATGRIFARHPRDRPGAEDIQVHNPSQPAEPYPTRTPRTRLRLVLSFAVHAASLRLLPLEHNQKGAVCHHRDSNRYRYQPSALQLRNRLTAVAGAGSSGRGQRRLVAVRARLNHANHSFHCRR